MAIKNSIDSQLPIPIADGGTGETTRQAAIDSLTNVSAATAGQVLTKDGSGNATFQPATPIGSVIMFTGSAAPSGWLICDGSEISRTAYSSLFSVCGETYGVGDTTTTFNIPDLRQKFVLGKSASGTGSTLGETGGEIDHDHSVPSHNHGRGTLTVDSESGHIHSIAHNHAAFTSADESGHIHSIAHNHASVNTSSDTHSHSFSGTTTTTGSQHQHSIVHDVDHSSVGGNSQAFRTGSNSPTGPVRYYTDTILTSTDGSHTHTFSGTTVTDTHYHSVDLPSFSGNSGNSTGHTHSIDIPEYTGNSGAGSSHTHTLSGIVGNTSGVSGDSAMTSGSNNPPFVVLNYIIKAE